MTQPDPTHADPTHADPAPDGDARLPPESRAARSLTDRSRPEETDAEPTQEPEHRPRIWPRVLGVAILLLGAGGAWVWQNPGFVQSTFGSLFPASASQTSDTAKIEALETRVAKLEQRPPPTDLTQRLDALEKRAAPDLRPLQSRLDALEGRVAAAGRMSPSVASAPAPAGPDIQPLVNRIDALEKAVAAEAAKPPAVQPTAELAGRLDEMTHQLHDLTATEAKHGEALDRAVRLARLDAASIDLALGHALGPIPDAPPALARFANAAPPTEAALRLSFPAAAETALKVSQAETGGKPFLDRVIARLRETKLITVREGDEVVIGNPAAASLAHARLLLEAGDVAGAARTVTALKGPPAEQMAPWLADANALVAAREALASLGASLGASLAGGG